MVKENIAKKLHIWENVQIVQKVRTPQSALAQLDVPQTSLKTPAQPIYGSKMGMLNRITFQLSKPWECDKWDDRFQLDLATQFYIYIREI